MALVTICLTVLAVLGALVPAWASASSTRVPLGFSPLDGSGSGGIMIASPGGVAIDEATGNVFLNDGDGYSSPNVTDILGAEGAAPVGLVSPFQLTGFCFPGTQNGVAFDNSPTSPNQGTLYVFDCGGKVKKFTRNPLSEEYEPAGELTATGGTFEAAAGAAVDTHGNLFLTDAFGPGVVKFNPAGTQIAYFDLASSVNFVSGVAVDPAGDLFVSGAGVSYKYPADGSGEIDPDVFTKILPEDATGVAVDPARNKLYIAFSNPARVAQYDATTLVKELEFGAGTLGSAYRLAVNSATDRVYVADANNNNVAVFGPPVTIPTVTTNAASGVTGTKATLNAAINPEGLAVTECIFEYGPTSAYGDSKPCEGALPADSSSHPVTAAIGGLIPNGATYHFRVVAKNANGTSTGADRTLVTGTTVTTSPVSAVAVATATVNGVVRPEGTPFTECKFEYGTSEDYGSSKPCSPAAGSIDADFEAHAVSANLSALAPNTTYHFRLSATNASGTATGNDLTFTTLGPPQIAWETANPVGQTSGSLSAEIDPSGSATSYRFEWGTDTSYGNQAPAEFDPVLAAGTDPVKVTAKLSGLSPSTAYHFRVVATNSVGTTNGPDKQFITLNTSGVADLPDNRGIELVSPADKGVQGAVMFQLVSFNSFQIAEDGQSVAFPLLGGLADTDAGGDTVYMAKRSPSAWQSTKISPPSSVPAPIPGLAGNASPGPVFYYSPNLSCGVVWTFNPLTEDTPKASTELGVYNLYVRHDDGTHTLITDTVPSNPDAPPLVGVGLPTTILAGASEDCSKVYFESPYKYLPDASGLYEWDNGTLRDAGRLPTGAAGAGGSFEAFIGNLFETTARLNSVSPDGSRFAFTALSNEPATVGKPAVFVRKDGGASVVEASRKQGGSADSLGAQYQTASPDGAHVFFLATYGLTPDSSSGPAQGCGSIEPDDPDLSACDLYDYDVDSGQLTNLSATTSPANPKGAVARGVLAVSDDGESVYFAAVGRLVPGKGRTYAENVAGSTANLYLARGGQLSYVGTMTMGDLNGAALRTLSGGSHVTPDGEHLLFESKANVTGYVSGGVGEAYLYSATADKTICISCRPDGQPSVGWPTLAKQSLVRVSSGLGRLRAISDDGSRAFFTKPDVLAPGAVSGDVNIYEWENGQVHLLHSGPPGGGGFGGIVASTAFLGTSPSGEDVFIRSSEQLTPHDKDLVLDLYDFRGGGGFAPPPQTPLPCNPAADECQGAPSAQPAAQSPASAGFSGPGNPPESKPRPKTCPKGKVRRHGRCVKRPKQSAKQKQRKRSRAANSNRGGVK